jgi:transketolase
LRNAFAAELTALAATDRRLVMMVGDIGNRLFDDYKAQFPDRFYNCGVAEANMIGMAAGLAMSGLRPVAYTITPFITSRCFEQIRLDVCYHRQPVVIVGVGSGLSYASLGATHHSCEDIAIMRSLPHMVVVCPGDPLEARAALRAALAQTEPVYIRLGIKGEPIVHGEPIAFELGRGLRVREGRDVCLLVTGNLLPVVREAAELLAADGLSAAVWSVHTVKPLDRTLLEQAFAAYDLVVSVEEHGLIGGFGSAVAEWMADRGPVRAGLLRIGTPDAFLHEAGNQAYARKRLGLTAGQVADTVRARRAVTTRA